MTILTQRLDDPYVLEATVQELVGVVNAQTLIAALQELIPGEA